MLTGRAARLIALTAAAALAASVVVWFAGAVWSGRLPLWRVAGETALLALAVCCVAIVTHYRRRGGQ